MVLILMEYLLFGGLFILYYWLDFEGQNGQHYFYNLVHVLSPLPSTCISHLHLCGMSHPNFRATDIRKVHMLLSSRVPMRRDRRTFNRQVQFKMRNYYKKAQLLQYYILQWQPTTSKILHYLTKSISENKI